MSDIRRRPIGSWAAIEAWERVQAGEHPDYPEEQYDMDETESAHATEVSIERGNAEVHSRSDAHTPGYHVSANGVVTSLASNWRGYGARIMQHSPNSDGYPSVRILVNGKRKRIAVHVLVAQHYLPARPSPSHEVRHLDGDKLNPNASNLAWGTQKENADDRERHGRTSSGVKHSLAIKAGQAVHV